MPQRSFNSRVCVFITFVLLLPILSLAACVSAPVPAPKVPTATARLAQPATPQPAPAQGAAARVNGQEIPLAAYQKVVAQYQAMMTQQGVNPNTPDGQAQLAQMKQQRLDNMIDDVLVTQEAAKEGVSVTDAELDAAMQDIINNMGGQANFEKSLQINGQTLDEARATQRIQMLYLKMRDRVIANIKTAEQVHARHILVDSLATAQALLAQIQAGADFGQLAQQASLDTLTKANGGDLGWFPRGTLPSKELEDAAFSLQPGQVSNVIQSAFGYHILQVLERDPARPLEGEQLVQVQQQAFENWLNGLRANAKVEILVNP